MPEHYREVLVLRFLEELSTSEMAAVLGITEAAVKTRQTRTWIAWGVCWVAIPGRMSHDSGWPTLALYHGSRPDPG